MMNVCMLVGRVATEPELTYTKSGVPCCKFRLAVDRNYRNSATGERETDFVDIVSWRKLAEFCANYLVKGRLISLRGSLQVSQWTAADNTKRRNVQIVADELRCLDYPNGSARADMAATVTEDSNPQLPNKVLVGAVVGDEEDWNDPFADAE